MLDQEIRHFLLCVARWNVRWFNKPKFHIILHLVEHIRRFGPAGLFATEGFESFNAVIRAKSVHSNRQAPSRDIARAFAQGNRIRHLLSGGFFQVSGLAESDGAYAHRSTVDTARAVPAKFSFSRADWATAGAGPLNLVQTSNTITAYLGLERLRSIETQTTTANGEFVHTNGLLTAHKCSVQGHAHSRRTLVRPCPTSRQADGSPPLQPFTVIVTSSQVVRLFSLMGINAHQTALLWLAPPKNAQALRQ